MMIKLNGLSEIVRGHKMTIVGRLHVLMHGHVHAMMNHRLGGDNKSNRRLAVIHDSLEYSHNLRVYQ